MPRSPRIAPGGVVYHVMNRAALGVPLFTKDLDYLAFEKVLTQAKLRLPAVRVCAYVLMPNHFHLVLWPRDDDLLSPFMRWLTMTHTQRWHAHRKSAGRGHVYQSRFKSFPVQRDAHLLSVLRYVERNPLRAKLVARAQDWPWSSLSRRLHDPDRAAELLDDWPIETAPSAPQWIQTVNEPESPEELAALRSAATRGRPFGDDRWTARTATRLSLKYTLRPRGRPRKTSPEPKKK